MSKPSTPIRRALMNMIFLSCGVVLLVTSAAFCAYEFLTFRSTSIQQLQILSGPSPPTAPPRWRSKTLKMPRAC